ncbi:MAG: sigma-70 family RNA polymerase sigma factor [Carboxylicivirga sp.]|nr:sigma-70 family RNA polymerase sigma factor [Carboxylicivirga sp.]MCT4647028.1 sigma-70 family RNA polymerase sigma factor [Carboxylicivirga sp.]
MAKIDQKIKQAFAWNANKAFKLLYDHFYNELAVKGVSIIGDYAAVEDIIQNLFLKIYNEKRYVYISDFQGYLKLAVRNECFNYLKQKRTVELSEAYALSEENVSDPRIEEIKDNLYLLPPKCREIFEKIVFEEYTYESVANNNNISLNTVKTQMKRAYKILRQSIGSIYFSLFF